MRLSSLGHNETSNQPDQSAQPLSMGSRLRQARETKGLTLEQISAITRISVSILTALENGETEKLRSAVSSRGFLKIYAEYLGMDSNEILTQWTKAEPRKRPAAAPSVTSKKLMQSEAYAERPILLSGKQVLPALFVVLLLFISFIIYRAYFADSANDEPIENTAPATPPAHKKSDLQIPVPNNSQPATPMIPPDKATLPKTAVFKQPAPALQPIAPPPNSAGSASQSQETPDNYTARSHSNPSPEQKPGQ